MLGSGLIVARNAGPRGIMISRKRVDIILSGKETKETKWQKLPATRNVNV